MISNSFQSFVMMSPENSVITFSPRRISKGLQRVGFADELIPLMTAIALAESSGLPYAHNRNQFTGDDSYGLFQINMIDEIGVERRKLLGLNNNDDLFNPRKNFEAAKFIFDQQGLRAWGAYRNGSYRDYLSLLMADEAYLKNVKGISWSPIFVLAASNVMAEVSREGSVAFRFAVNETSSRFIADGFRSDGLITRRMLQRWKQQAWDELLGQSDTREISDDFTLSLFLAQSSEFSMAGQEVVYFDNFVKKNGYFFVEIDGKSETIDSIQRRLDAEMTIQGNILFVMDDYRVSCGNEFMIGS